MEIPVELRDEVLEGWKQGSTSSRQRLLLRISITQNDSCVLWSMFLAYDSSLMGAETRPLDGAFTAQGSVDTERLFDAEQNPTSLKRKSYAHRPH